jgi:hypothetical protein
MATDTAFEQLTGDPRNVPRKMPELTWPYPCQQGFAPVAQARSSAPVNIYYELHGDGPRRILLIMGMYTRVAAP